MAAEQSMAMRFPALVSLGLRSEHLSALARQGILREEDAPRGNRYYKLRFRLGARQCVRYVGRNVDFAAQVRGELLQLQEATRTGRDLQRLMREASKCLIRTKERLEPLLPLVGRCFHGREIRRQPDGPYVEGNEFLLVTLKEREHG